MVERTYGPMKCNLDEADSMLAFALSGVERDTAADLVARIRELEDGLEKYGDHRAGCSIGFPCTCGLAELMGGGQ